MAIETEIKFILTDSARESVNTIMEQMREALIAIAFANSVSRGSIEISPQDVADSLHLFAEMNYSASLMATQECQKQKQESSTGSG